MDIMLTIAVFFVTLGYRNVGYANGSPTVTGTCLNGTCTGADESCLKNIDTTCPFQGSCTTSVTPNGQQVTVTVGCGPATCPTTTTPTPTTTATTTSATTKTTSTATTTITTQATGRKKRATPKSTNKCCLSALCNQYEAPDSAAFSVQTHVLYTLGLIMLINLLK